MKFGYARVSTNEQSLDLQIDALEKAGCQEGYIFSEKVSGKKKDRPQLKKMLERLRKGDTVMVWKIDRLGRSLKDLVNIVDKIKDKDAHFVSVEDNFDTTTAGGELFFHIFASLAQFESSLISKRTKAGLASARARGRKGGRPKGLSEKTLRKAKTAKTMYKAKNEKGVAEYSVTEICGELNISKSTLYRYLKELGVEVGSYNSKKS